MRPLRWMMNHEWGFVHKGVRNLTSSRIGSGKFLVNLALTYLCSTKGA